MTNRDPAREAILTRVRSGLRDAHRTRPQDVPRSYSRQRPTDDQIGLFCSRVADYQATVHRTEFTEAAETIATVLHDCGAHRVLAANGVPQQWWESLVSRFEHVDDGSSLDTSGLDRIDAVVTTAAVGIATTGTIVLDHGPGQGRRATTLVPDIHVCAVRESQIVDDVPAAISQLDPRKPLTFISGPSATSDIELDRVEGVHGPRTLHVLVLPDEGRRSGAHDG